MRKFSSDLILWYKENKRDLPWRLTTDVYEVWVSEVILQQTRVNQGLSYYYRFLNSFPTVNNLANASEDEVLKCWQGLGYYSRARNMHSTAKFVSQELNGVFPNTYEGLLKLKGIGTYTAAAISSMCFNEHRTVVDGNVFRVLTRIYGIDTPINKAAGKKEIEELANSLNNVADHGIFNQALMEFGALQCTPKKTDCASCVFNDTCWAFQNNKVEVLPVKEKKKPVKKRYLHYIHIRDRKNRTIIQRRNDNDIWKGLYQFPLIEVDDVLSTKDMMTTKEFKDFINNQDVDIISEHTLKHQLTHQKLFISILNIEVDSLGHFDDSDYQIIDVGQLKEFAVPKPLTEIW